MKHLRTYLNQLFFVSSIFCLLGLGSGRVCAQYVQIPDTNMVKFLKVYCPTCMSGDSLNTILAINVTKPMKFDCTINGINFINNFFGLQYFFSTRKLIFGDNNQICNTYLFGPYTTLNYLPPNIDTLKMYNYGIDSIISLPSVTVYFESHESSLKWIGSTNTVLQSFHVLSSGLTSLPVLPNSVIYLTVTNSFLNSLPTLPAFLITLDVSRNNLTSLPTLPNSLVDLGVSYNKLSSIPSLPNSLGRLFCNSNKLTSLPSLPLTLRSIYASNNLLTTLPTLPTNLSFLSIGHNPITTIPSLPNLYYFENSGNSLIPFPSLPSTLRELRITNNNLINLPPNIDSLSRLDMSNNPISTILKFPNNLSQLKADSCNLINLPIIPSSLFELRLRRNNLTCLPILPPNLYYFSCENNPITCLPNIPQNSYFYSSLPICNPFNTSVCKIYPKIKGNVFFDMDGDTLKSSFEVGVKSRILDFNSVPYLSYFYTDSLGDYTAYVDTGTFIFTIRPTKYFKAVPSTKTVSVPSYNATDSLNDFALQPQGLIQDLKANLVCTTPAIRPALACQFSLNYENIGTIVSGDSVVFVYDTNMTFASAVPPPSSHVGNRLKWSISPLNFFEQRQILASFVVDTFLPLQTVLNNTATIYPVATDTTPTDNLSQAQTLVVNSFDPNEKVVQPANLTPAQAAAREPLFYTIYFQNLGTADAIDITVKDTLSTTLDLSTFEMLASSHPNYTLAVVNRVAHWVFKNIHLPAASVNEPASHGWVKFKILPKAGLVLGDSIRNRAGIYFDYNKPIITNYATNRVQNPTAIEPTQQDRLALSVFPNPTTGSFTLSTSLNAKGPVSIELLNLTGQRVYQAAYQAAAGSFQCLVDAKDLSNGLYFVQIRSASGSGQSKVLVGR
jgi:uncharacterized repeat protein (TIGR01451 family)